MEAHLETRPTTIHDVLASLREAATDERHKGDLFEGLMASYLRTDPVYRTRFSDVWLWMDWPDRDGKADTGIDLVAKDRETGELCAIQCKFYAAEIERAVRPSMKDLVRANRKATA